MQHQLKAQLEALPAGLHFPWWSLSLQTCRCQLESTAVASQLLPSTATTLQLVDILLCGHSTPCGHSPTSRRYRTVIA